MIVKNSIRCNHCHEVVVSEEPFAPVYCSCGACAADGGQKYLRRLGRGGTDFTELAERSLQGAPPPRTTARPPRRRGAVDGSTGRGLPGGGGKTAPSRLGGQS